jgi:hypothetical protein
MLKIRKPSRRDGQDKQGERDCRYDEGIYIDRETGAGEQTKKDQGKGLGTSEEGAQTGIYERLRMNIHTTFYLFFLENQTAYLRRMKPLLFRETSVRPSGITPKDI